MTWMGLVPVLAASWCLFVLPGTGLLRILGVGGVFAWAGGPAVTAAILGAGAIVLQRIGVGWSLSSVIVLTIATWCVAIAVRYVSRRTLPTVRADTGWPVRIGLVGSVAAGALIIAYPIWRGMAAPDAILQQWDAIFHLSGVASIRDTGMASSIGGLDTMFGGLTGVFYPAVWHSIVAVTPLTASIPAAANASTYVLGAGVWSLGLAGLAAAVFPRHRVAWMVAPVMGAAFIAFPTAVMSIWAMWPYAYSVAVMPGACALMILALRAGVGRGRRVCELGIAAAAAVGAILAHSSAVFSIVAVMLPYLVGVGLRAVVRVWQGGARIRSVLWVCGSVLAVTLAVAAAARSGVFTGVLGFPRPAQSTTADALRATLLLSPPVDRPLLRIVVLMLVVVGVVAVFVVRHGRWLPFSFAILVGLTVLASGPENPLRWLTGFWYRHPGRLSALLSVPVALLAALGTAAVAGSVGWFATRAAWDAMSRRHLARSAVVGATATGLVAVAFMTSGNFDQQGRADWFAASYQPGKIATGTMVSEEERALLDDLATILPADAVLLGDPFAGAAFAYPIAGVEVVFPQAGASGLSADQRILRQRFRDIATDPEVCAAVQRRGVTHFWSKPPASVQGVDTARAAPGLYDVDTASGFTHVAGAGDVTVYRIDVCR